MSEKRKKKKRKKRNREKEHTPGALIYDASWITIKRYFTFLGDTPPSNWSPRREQLKRNRERKINRRIIIIEADNNRANFRERGRVWLIRGGGGVYRLALNGRKHWIIFVSNFPSRRKTICIWVDLAFQLWRREARSASAASVRRKKFFVEN